MSDDNKTGGPAFPFHDPGYGQFAPETCSGMTLRDYFAAKAMQVLLSFVVEAGRTDRLKNVAAAAYEMADNMLEARGAA